MSPKEFIASGILEKYALGLASEQERQEVEDYVAKYSEVQTELEAIEIAIEKYLTLQGIPAPKNLEAKVLEKINADATSKPTPPKENKPPTKDSGNGGFPWLPLLLGIGLLASLIGLFMMNRSNNQLKAELNRVQAELQTLREDCQTVRNENQLLNQKVEILQNIDNQPVYLNATDENSNAIAAVYWNATDQKAYLNTISLPTPPSDKQYQLWAIVDGNPVDMGVFDVVNDSTAIQEVPFIGGTPAAFAVTLEPLGGNPTPTLEEMVVIGNVS